MFWRRAAIGRPIVLKGYGENDYNRTGDGSRFCAGRARVFTAAREEQRDKLVIDEAKLFG